MLLSYAAAQAGVAPSRLDIAQLDAPMIGAFLDHLERERGNSVRTRNARLAAIHSLFRFAALQRPEHAASISRVLAIQPKRCDQALVTYLTDNEIDALLAAPDPGTRTGRRDRALLLLDIQTGLRISELTGLTVADVHLGTGAHVACHGKGRKDRITPLTAETVLALREWLAEHDPDPHAPLFPGRTGQQLSRDAIEHRIAPPRQGSSSTLPEPAHQAGDRPRAATHHWHAAAARRRRHRRHRALARPRKHRDDEDLPVRRPRTQTEGDRQNPPTGPPVRPISPAGQADRLARSALIMPTF
jgi:integrase/recombinase XerD